MHRLKAQSARAVLWAAVRLWVTQGWEFLVFVIVSRQLAPADFGTITFASAILAMLRIMIEGGMTTMIVRAPSLTPLLINTIFWTNVAIAAVLAGIVALAAPAIASACKVPMVAEVLPWLALGMLFQGLSEVQRGLLRRNMEFRLLAMRSFLAALTGGIFGVVMAFRGFGVWSLVALHLTGGAAGTVLLWSVRTWAPAMEYSWTQLRGIMNFSLLVLAEAFVQAFARRLDHLLVGGCMGTASLGLFSSGQRLANGIKGLFQSALGSAALPAFAKVQDDPERLRRAVITTTRLSAATILPALAIAAIVARPLIEMLLGSRWAGAAVVVQATAVATAITQVFRVSRSALLASGHAGRNLLLQVAGTIARAIAIVTFAPAGLPSVALALVAVEVLVQPLDAIYARRRLGLKFSSLISASGPPILTTLLASGAAVAVLAALPGAAAPLQVALPALTLIAVHIGALAVLKPDRLSEIESVIRLALKRPAHAGNRKSNPPPGTP